MLVRSSPCKTLSEVPITVIDTQTPHSMTKMVGHDINFLTDLLPKHRCARCDDCFTSRNQLRKHHCSETKVPFNASVVSTSLPSTSLPRVIPSEVTPDQSNGGPGCAFRSWQYAKVEADIGDTKVDICADSGCPVSMGGRECLKKLLPHTPILKTAFSVPVRGVGGTVIKTDDYVVVRLAFHGKLGDAYVKGVVTAEIHIIDNFAANLLLGNDV